MNPKHHPAERDKRAKLGELEHEVKTLARRLDVLHEQVQWLKAREIARRIDAGEEILIPSEVAGRVFVENVHPLKAFREWRGLSQAELAGRAETSKSYISQIETGYRQPGRKLLSRLARVLEVPVDVLMD